MPKPIGSTTYLPGIDGLRTVAVLAVLAYHLQIPGVAGGLLGVGIFFTLSGYLITSILIRGWDKYQKVDFKSFWLRRIRRLYPAVLVLLATVICVSAIVDPKQLAKRGWETLSALFYYNNWYEISQGNSYFDRFSGPQPLEHMWSLAVEEQFYLFWPIIFAVLMWVFRNRPNPKKNMFLSCLLLAGLSTLLMALLFVPGQDATRIYEGTDTRAAGLLIGGALAFIWPSRQTGTVSKPEIFASDMLGIVGFATILAMILGTDGQSTWLYQGGFLLLSVATALTIVPLAIQDSRLSKIFGVAPMKWLGERSYGIYLWHMPVLAFTPTKLAEISPWLSGVTVSFGSILLASLSWTLIEDPIRIHGLVGIWKDKAWPKLLAGITGVLVLAITVLSVPNKLIPTQPDALDLSASQGGVTGEVTATQIPSATPTGSANSNEVSNDVQTEPALTLTKPTTTSCSQVIYVGDSTSIALISDGSIPDKTDQLPSQFTRVGVTKFNYDIKGARATIEHYKKDENSAEAVQRLRSQASSNTCWVIALGTNDAANMSVGGVGPASMRIQKLLDIIGDQPVLWLTLKTQNPSDKAYSDAGMSLYNTDLKAQCDSYPNLHIYDWAAEVQPEWYLKDGIHPNSVGAINRARMIADALAIAHPEGSSPAKNCVIRTGKP